MINRKKQLLELLLKEELKGELKEILKNDLNKLKSIIKKHFSTAKINYSEDLYGDQIGYKISIPWPERDNDKNTGELSKLKGKEYGGYSNKGQPFTYYTNTKLEDLIKDLESSFHSNKYWNIKSFGRERGSNQGINAKYFVFFRKPINI